LAERTQLAVGNAKGLVLVGINVLGGGEGGKRLEPVNPDDYRSVHLPAQWGLSFDDRMRKHVTRPSFRGFARGQYIMSARSTFVRQTAEFWDA
jgi:hypothetical protein